MTRKYEPLLDANGNPNPKHKKDTRKGDRHKDKSHTHRKSGSHSCRKKDMFIAIDGEGINTGLVVGYSSSGQPVYEQNYVLMTASTEGILIDYIINEDGLSTSECFKFLLRLRLNFPKAIFV